MEGSGVGGSAVAALWIGVIADETVPTANISTCTQCRQVPFDGQESWGCPPSVNINGYEAAMMHGAIKLIAIAGS